MISRLKQHPVNKQRTLLAKTQYENTGKNGFLFTGQYKTITRKTKKQENIVHSKEENKLAKTIPEGRVPRNARV